MKYPDARILVFSKAPVPGQVKTRLIPLLGHAGAAGLYCTLLENTLEKLLASRLCAVELHCDPSTGHDYFQYCQQRYAVTLRQQAAGDLGVRMSVAMQDCLAAASAAILVGADCPALSAQDIGQALEYLHAGSDLVLGPARDGGYYLVGMRRHHAGVFTDIPWGSTQVLTRTLQLADRLGLRHHLLETRDDIDTPDDYLAWRAGEFTSAL
jgi:rSAM/selenodomain-associated transferase 1